MVAVELERVASASLYRSVARAVRNLARLDYVLAMSKKWLLVRDTRVILTLNDPERVGNT